MINTKKYLIISDLDNTIIDGFSSDATLTLLKNQELVHQIKHSHDPWSICMQKAFIEMKKEGIIIESLKEQIDNLKLNEKWKEVMEYVRVNIDILGMILLSGSISLFVEWFLEKHKYTDIVNTFYSLPYRFNTDLFITVDNIDHHCKTCKKEQCKSENIKDYLTKNPEYSKAILIYIGDGKNDLCPSKNLSEKDFLLPRYNWYLHQHLIQCPNDVICKVLPWKSGDDVIKALKEILI